MNKENKEEKTMNPNLIPDSPLAMFQSFSKIPRLYREMVITEKIDGTNAQVIIIPCPQDYVDGYVLHRWVQPDNTNMVMYAASRTRFIRPGDDNYGFAAWVKANAEELTKLGPGRHFGEWWGAGIQRRYGLKYKHFSLFNTNRWAINPDRPACCGVVPVLYEGPFFTETVEFVKQSLKESGSIAAPGFMNPEGVVVLHFPSGHLYKSTFDGDDKPKGQQEEFINPAVSP